MRILRRFLSLPAPERRLALEAVAWLCYSRTLLAVRGAAPIHHRLSKADADILEAAARGPHESELSFARTAARFVAAAQRRWPGLGSCLHAAVALALLLERRGLRPVIRLGARKDDSGFQAHAWVELGAVVLIGGESAPLDYAAFPRCGGAHPARAA